MQTYVTPDRKQVVEDSGNLSKHSTDVLSPQRNVNLKHFLNRERIALFLRHHGDIVEAIKVRQGLQVRFVLNELFGAAVQQPDMRIKLDGHLTVQLEDEAQHAVRGRVLRPEVEREVADVKLLLAVGTHARELVRLKLVEADLSCDFGDRRIDLNVRLRP